MRTLLIASDHAGFELKEKLKTLLPAYEWIDLGPANTERVDYPDFAKKLVERVAKDQTMGVLVCGSGQGMAIAANRHPGIRAALAWNEDVAKVAREHNDANILCLGARFIDSTLAGRLVDIFTATPFEGGRHANRVRKIERN